MYFFKAYAIINFNYLRSFESFVSRLFNAKSIFMKIVLFQTIQFIIGRQFKCCCW